MPAFFQPHMRGLGVIGGLQVLQLLSLATANEIGASAHDEDLCSSDYLAVKRMNAALNMSRESREKNDTNDFEGCSAR